MYANRYFVLLVSVMLFCVSEASTAVPLADWVALEGLSPRLALKMKHLRIARCIPNADDVDLPVYPQASIVSIDWGLVAPDCYIRDGWDELGAITFVSRENEKEVVKWYGVELPHYNRYLGEAGTIFINHEIDAFLWERDYPKFSNITVTAAPNGFRDAGYRSSIELNRPKVRTIRESTE